MNPSTTSTMSFWCEQFGNIRIASDFGSIFSGGLRRQFKCPMGHYWNPRKAFPRAGWSVPCLPTFFGTMLLTCGAEKSAIYSIWGVRWWCCSLPCRSEAQARWLLVSIRRRTNSPYSLDYPIHPNKLFLSVYSVHTFFRMQPDSLFFQTSKGKHKTINIRWTPLWISLWITVSLYSVDMADTEEPFGAKEAGEGAGNPAIASITNAISDAVGCRFRSLPSPLRWSSWLSRRRAEVRMEETLTSNGFQTWGFSEVSKIRFSSWLLESLWSIINQTVGW